MKRWINRYFWPFILLIYPLRHINWGLDLWDTGYNYANYTYAGLEHMDGMWFFSTYLSNIIGHVLTLLPGGHTLLFLNLYTGLFVSLLALLAYYFLTVRVQIPAPIVFLGELVAVSLCWCPTAVLYNYLTYVFFLLGIIFLYQGLVKDKYIFLILAGIALGLNVFVRFSNLPEAGLIVAVWAYGVICKKKFGKVVRETLLCLAGYLFAVAAVLGTIAVRYGLHVYVDGIKNLFAMTETATDYKATSMLYNMLHEYMDNFYWVNRILVFVVFGLVICLLLPEKLHKIKKLLCVGISVGCGAWLYFRSFCSMDYTSYGAMRRPAILFLILTLIVAAIRIIQKHTPREEKLLAGLIMLMVLLTSLGSNNGLFPSINNMFLAVPYVFWCSFIFLTSSDVIRVPIIKNLDVFSIKSILVLFLLIFIYQSIGFGTRFVFVEAQGVRNVDTKIENNAILKGIYTNKERAQWIREISEYVSENQLSGREVLLYGQIPALSFYLQMPSVFNPWSDLRSYRLSSMEAAMAELEASLEQGSDMPVIILENSQLSVSGDPKLDLILNFMEKHGYTQVFSNIKFALFEAEKRVYD